MRQKAHIFAIFLVTLASLLSLAGLTEKSAVCKLEAPEVDAVPPEVCFGQQVLVKAKMNVVSC